MGIDGVCEVSRDAWSGARTRAEGEEGREENLDEGKCGGRGKEEVGQRRGIMDCAKETKGKIVNFVRVIHRAHMEIGPETVL